MAKKLDTYQMWEKTGVLKSKLDYIKAASATFYTQKEMCRDLGITEQTFTQLKNKHPEIQQASIPNKKIKLVHHTNRLLTGL